jgi:long-subunit acyl-CoA synthetase (AMP-forming)
VGSEMCIRDREWTPAIGFLSPTLKIKRGAIEEYYAERIEKLFS